MKGLGYGSGYRYAHDYAEAFAVQDYLPEAIRRRRYYHPTDRGYEGAVKQRLDRWRQLTREKRKGGGGGDPQAS